MELCAKTTEFIRIKRLMWVTKSLKIMSAVYSWLATKIKVQFSIKLKNIFDYIIDNFHITMLFTVVTE